MSAVLIVSIAEMTEVKHGPVLEEDLKLSAAVAAYIIYELAVRDGKVPRKPVH